jgi:hypothetical protein
MYVNAKPYDATCSVIHPPDTSIVKNQATRDNTVSLQYLKFLMFH